MSFHVTEGVEKKIPSTLFWSNLIKTVGSIFFEKGTPVTMVVKGPKVAGSKWWYLLSSE